MKEREDGDHHQYHGEVSDLIKSVLLLEICKLSFSKSFVWLVLFSFLLLLFGLVFCWFFFLPKKALEDGLNCSHIISSGTEMHGVYAVLIWSYTRLSSLVSYFCYSVVQHLFWIFKMVLSPYNQFLKTELWTGCPSVFSVWWFLSWFFLEKMVSSFLS